MAKTISSAQGGTITGCSLLQNITRLLDLKWHVRIDHVVDLRKGQTDSYLQIHKLTFWYLKDFKISIIPLNVHIYMGSSNITIACMS